MTQPLGTFGLPSDVLLWQALALTALSYAVGVLGGFVGLALGTMRLPAMLLLGMPVATAGGTNILVSTLSAVAGSLPHLREGRVDRSVALWMGTTSAAGALAGGLMAGLAPDGILLGVAGAFVIWQAVEFVRLARRRAASAERRPSRSRRSLEAAIGFAIGFLGGAVGLILGSIRLPALVRLFGLAPQVAAGTNLLVGVLTGVAGWVGHVAIGAVDFPLLVALGAAGMLGQVHGARLTGRASAGALLYTMAAVLVVVGSLLVRDGLTRLR